MKECSENHFIADIGLLRDGTEALVGVLAMMTGAGGVDIDEPVQ